MGRRLRIIILAVAAISGLAATASPAHAVFHLMKVRELFPGTVANQNSAFVELQMYAAGQTLVAGHQIRSYTTASNPLGSFTIPNNVANGETQRTILIGDTGVAGRDATYDQLGETIQPNADGAALCFDTVDCVAWGSFASPAFLTSPAGSPVLPAAGIPNGSSITRRITPNCATLLEAADDTNNSAGDFAQTAPSPRPNSATPTETVCDGGGGGAPETTITKAPKNKTSKPKAKYKFTSSEANSTFQCALDKKIKQGKFKPCDSPFKKRVDDGKHRFQVAAVDAEGNVDPTPAKDKFKVVD